MVQLKAGLLFGFLCLGLPNSGFPKDLGTFGPTWEVAEPSILDTIKQRLGEMEESGQIAEMQREFASTTRDYVNRPRPVIGLTPAEIEHQFDVDLSVTLTQDLADHRGVVFARAGTVINPLRYSTFNKRIVFLDGDSDAQVDFALSHGTELDTLLVLVNGPPLELMRAHGRRFYFDQDGQMVDRFHITRLPSEVVRNGDVMTVFETPVE